MNNLIYRHVYRFFSFLYIEVTFNFKNILGESSHLGVSDDFLVYSVIMLSAVVLVVISFVQTVVL